MIILGPGKFCDDKPGGSLGLSYGGDYHFFSKTVVICPGVPPEVTGLGLS